MGTFGTIITVLLVFGIPITLSVWISSSKEKRKKARLMSQAKITERPETEHLTQSSVFTTKTQNISKIFDVINQTSLREEHISFDPDFSAGMIVFRYSGGFCSSLRSNGSKGDLFCYTYQTERYKAFGDTGFAYNSKTSFASNVILTAIENAFKQLDPETDISRQKGHFS